MEHTIIEKGYHKRETCGSCNGSDFKTILDLGTVPLAGYFPSEDQMGVESKYPLSLLVCIDCKLTQTDSVINPKLDLLTILLKWRIYSMKNMMLVVKLY